MTEILVGCVVRKHCECVLVKVLFTNVRYTEKIQFLVT
jgi:hypothetical protein